MPIAVDAIARLRGRAPLVHNITNYVVMNSTANALLAIGASPAMVHAPEEAPGFARMAQALVINIGTLSSPWLSAMEGAARAAVEAGVPWVLDPVAAGATPFRQQAAARLAALKPAAIRGNASEVLALAGGGAAGRGVDSTDSSDAARDAARALARRFGTVVAVTGAIDHVTDGDRVVSLANGHVLLTRVTGTGCVATALTGAFLGAGLAAFDASVAALASLGVAAELAAERGGGGPGSFETELRDALYRLDDATLQSRMRAT